MVSPYRSMMAQVRSLSGVPGGPLVQDSLGLTGCPAGVEHEEGILCVHGLRITFGRLIRDNLVVPMIAPINPVDRCRRPPRDDHVRDRWARHECLIHRLPQRYRAPVPPTLVLGDDSGAA